MEVEHFWPALEQQQKYVEDMEIIHIFCVSFIIRSMCCLVRTIYSQTARPHNFPFQKCSAALEQASNVVINTVQMYEFHKLISAIIVWGGFTRKRERENNFLSDSITGVFILGLENSLKASQAEKTLQQH